VHSEEDGEGIACYNYKLCVSVSVYWYNCNFEMKVLNTVSHLIAPPFLILEILKVVESYGVVRY
jgi:hypothetical protein